MPWDEIPEHDSVNFKFNLRTTSNDGVSERLETDAELVVTVDTSLWDGHRGDTDEPSLADPSQLPLVLLVSLLVVLLLLYSVPLRGRGTKPLPKIVSRRKLLGLAATETAAIAVTAVVVAVLALLLIWFVQVGSTLSLSRLVLNSLLPLAVLALGVVVFLLYLQLVSGALYERLILTRLRFKYVVLGRSGAGSFRCWADWWFAVTDRTADGGRCRADRAYSVGSAAVVYRDSGGTAGLFRGAWTVGALAGGAAVSAASYDASALTEAALHASTLRETGSERNCKRRAPARR